MTMDSHLRGNDEHKFSAYSSYKDSGIEWLGEVPENWAIVRLKDLGFLQNGVSKGGDYFGSGFPFVSYGNVYNDTVLSTKIKTFANSTPEDQQAYSCKSGDVFFTRTSETIEEIGFSATCLKTIPKAVFSGFVIRFRSTTNKLVPGFSNFYFSAKVLRSFFSKEIALVTRASLGQGLLNKLAVILPPASEQRSIANYLDTKTAQIDRKIELLSQKAEKYGKLKQSLINETVTRGLDKSVPMKDSGIEWIGDVPAHWKVKRSKEVFEISRGRVIAQTELIDGGEFPVYSSQTKNDGCLGFINTFDYEGSYITWTTDGVNAGTVFLRKGRFNCTNICGTLKLKAKKCEMTFLLYALQVCTKHNKRIDTNGAKIMSNEMMFIKIALPPYDEQLAIAIYLDEKTTKIDLILETVNSQINNLKELRKTLINDVVTGKIKVVDHG